MVVLIHPDHGSKHPFHAFRGAFASYRGPSRGPSNLLRKIRCIAASMVGGTLEVGCARSETPLGIHWQRQFMQAAAPSTCCFLFHVYIEKISFIYIFNFIHYYVIIVNKHSGIKIRAHFTIAPDAWSTSKCLSSLKTTRHFFSVLKIP
jgi:hypothetical protein